MDYEEISKMIKDYWGNQPIPKERTIRMYTSVRGMDIIEERLDEHIGFKRIPIGKKVLRILRVLKLVIRKNKAGTYYKLVSNKKH